MIGALQWRLIASAVALVILAGAGLRTWTSGRESGRAEVQARWDSERAAMATAAASASEAARIEEQRRDAAQRKVVDDATNALAAARADALRAGATVAGLRTAASIAAARCNRTPDDPGTVEPSAPASDAGSVLADMLGRAADMAGRLAAVADERGVAGTACERAYDALIKGVAK